MQTERDAHVQALRGLAVLLMVAGHVVGGSADRGLQVDDDSWWRLAHLAFDDFRMPLFTLLSGYVYALRPVVGRGTFERLAVGKTRRLLVPLVTVGTLLFATQLVVPGINNAPDPGDLWRVYLFDFEHLWFLQAIFLVFMAVGAAELVGLLRSPTRWAGVLVASCLVYVLLQAPATDNVFSINGALRLLPFFLLGLGMRRFAGQLDRRRWSWVSVPVLVVTYATQLVVIATDTGLPGPPGRLLGLAVGLSGLTTLFLVRHLVRSRPLAWLGTYSFGVYLLHVFGAAGGRLLFQQLGIETDLALFLLCVTTGIAFPVLVQKLLGRFPVVSWGIFGQRPDGAAPRTPVASPTR